MITIKYPVNLDAGPDPGSVLEKKWTRVQPISLNFTEFFFNKAEFSNFCLIFFAFLLQLEPFRTRNFDNLSFSIVQIWVLRVNFFCSFWLIFYPWIRIRGSVCFRGSNGSGS